MLESVLRRIEETKAQGRLLIHEPMARHTTFRVGGPADALFLADSEDAMLSVMAVCRETHTPMTFIGRGSNLIVRDKGIRGLVIAPGEGMARMEREGDILTAGAGASLSALSAEAARWGLSGLEFASGIPGSVGGGVAMNAGAYGGEIKDVLVDARVYGLSKHPAASGGRAGALGPVSPDTGGERGHFPADERAQSAPEG